jgi:hypothetical protein
MNRTIPENPDTTTIENLIKSLEDLRKDVNSAELDGNKSAAKRIRKELLNLEKTSKEYRKRMLDIAKGGV